MEESHQDLPLRSVICLTLNEHVEVSASVWSLSAVDEFVTKLLGNMNDWGERLVSVVDSVRDGTAVSTTFTRSSYVQQSRVPTCNFRASGAVE